MIAESPRWPRVCRATARALRFECPARNLPAPADLPRADVCGSLNALAGWVARAPANGAGSMNTLLLRLEGPLQSWGLRAHWEERDSAFEPTKSGVVGLLGCALGLRRRRLDDRLREVSEALEMGVRVNRPGILLVDYHTTGGAKEPDSEPEGMLNAEGKRKRETDVSKRVYLMDASFLVALRGPAELVAELAAALRAPVWPVFLGRKACVPTCPVLVGLSPARERARGTAGAAAARAARSPQCAPGSRDADWRGQATQRRDWRPARRLFWPRTASEGSGTPLTP